MIAHTTEFDGLIEAAAAKYLPEWDWRWWRAQLIAESQLDPKAVSPVGAEGLPQLMPRTRAELYRKLKFPATATAFDPEFAIPAGAYYMAQLRRAWWMDRAEDERRKLAQASYNAGLGNLLAAQKKASGAKAYALIAAALPLVTGTNNAAETTGYVSRIDRIYRDLIKEQP